MGTALPATSCTARPSSVMLSCLRPARLVHVVASVRNVIPVGAGRCSACAPTSRPPCAVPSISGTAAS